MSEANTTRLSGPFEMARGVIGREPSADEFYIFEFDEVDTRAVHMLGVRSPLEVRFYVEGELEHEEILAPWVGVTRARADCIIETGVKP
jgi:hypothetical protein